MTDSIARTALIRDLSKRAANASLDELRVVSRILARLELGRERYGLLDLPGDRRDWRRERSEELLDAVVYDTLDQLREEDCAHERARDEIGTVAADHETRVATDSELAELLHWQAADQRTVASDVPALIASTDGEPYEAIEIHVDDMEAG